MIGLYAAVAVIGGLVGAGELVVRYRDDPRRALFCLAAGLYIGINVAASLAAYGLIKAFGWGFGQPSGTDAQHLTQVLAAGFGAMALLRSSLFLVRVGDKDVGIGPSGVIEGFLGAADRAVDRQRGSDRSEKIRGLLAGVSWEQAREELPALCLGLMQNATPSEQQLLARTVTELEAGDLDADVRVYLVGLSLLNFAGAGVLTGAVAMLHGEG
jgi:hypothetical protein